MDLSARFEFRHSTRQILFGWGVRVELGRLAQQHGARRCAIPGYPTTGACRR